MIFMRLLSIGMALFLVNAAPASESPTRFKVSEFQFSRPAAWEWVETTSPMRKAQLKVWDTGKKQSAEIVFFHFGEGDGGGTKANVERWFGQFAEPREKINAKSEDVSVGGRKVTYVQAEGTYQSGMPFGPKTPMSNYALLGAIIEDAKGSVFVKFTGPNAVAKASRDEFRKMVESALK